MENKETLEEAAKNYTIDFSTMSAFTLGAKWQTEQDNNKYGEEEVLDLLYKRDLYLFNRDEEIELELPEEWFEQFKKK